jgi:hypothetical protein
VDLSGVITWLDASVTASLNLTGSTVNSITDQSSNAYVFGVNGAIAKPTYSATGFNTSFPSLLFAGSPGQSLAKSSYGMGTGNTITTWAVMRRTSGGDNDARLWSYTAAAASHDYDNAGSWLLDTVNSSPQSYMFRNLQKSIGTIVIGNNYRIIGTINASGVITTYINGVAQSTQTASGNWVSAGILAIGDTSIAGDPSRFDGAIAEAGVATGFSNAATVSQLDLYLKNKWGL